MDLSYSDEEKAFRDEVRAFLEEKVTPGDARQGARQGRS